ncbi:MAG: nucleotidyltransferase family protein [Synergistaceae bacterium]|nr:nucleotidyltransferase family protein [Synergistaceae bacterium]
MTQLERTVSILEANKELLKQFHVGSLSVFGSVARGEAGPDSDIDLLVDFEPGARIGFFAFARLQKCLEELLGTKVDLVTPDALHEGMRAEIIEEAVHAI